MTTLLDAQEDLRVACRTFLDALKEATARDLRRIATWGHGRLVVVNLYALRATDPKALWSHPDPVGPDNGWTLGGGLLRDQGHETPRMIVAAWGVNARRPEVESFRRSVGLFYRSAYCLGRTKAGAPRHPLYVRGDTVPEVLWA